MMSTNTEMKKSKIKRFATFYGGDDKLAIVNSLLLGSNSTQSEVKIEFDEAVTVDDHQVKRFQMKVRSVVRKQHPETIIIAGTIRCIYSPKNEEMNVHIKMHFDEPMEASIEFVEKILEQETQKTVNYTQVPICLTN